MRKLVTKGFILLSFMLLPAIGNSVALASPDGAKEFIEKTSNDAMKIITVNISDHQKEEQLTALFIDSVDTKWIAKFAMGRFWKGATEEQRNKYIALHKKFLLKGYIPKFKEYTNQQVKVIKAPALQGDTEWIVETKIVTTNGTDVNIDYKIRKNDAGKYIIFDVVAEGISLITTQHSDFASILSREGVDKLIEKLGTDS